MFVQLGQRVRLIGSLRYLHVTLRTPSGTVVEVYADGYAVVQFDVAYLDDDGNDYACGIFHPDNLEALEP